MTDPHSPRTGDSSAARMQPWKPGSPGSLVVITRSVGQPGPWAPVVASLAGIFGLDPTIEAAPSEHTPRTGAVAVMARAAGVLDPVLVLPAPEPAEEVDVQVAARQLRRVLVPFDTSPHVAEAIGPVLDRLQAAGVEVTQIHALTVDSAPVMWEGPGHHAAAWHTELRHRHQVGDAALAVVSGPPALAVAAHSGDADLVLLCWKRRPTEGRARVIRGVLASATIPVLLTALS
jgi:hypothetical protein